MSLSDPTTPTGPTTPTTADRLRQAAVTLTYLGCIYANLVGAGVIGSREVSTANNAIFADDATLLTPAGPAFSIWSLIYLGLAAYVIVQWRPVAATDPRHRAIGWLVVAASVLNAVWLWVALDGYVWLSIVVIAILAAVLGDVIRRLDSLERRNGVPDRLEALATDGTFGAYLGWVSLATVANIAATFGADDAPWFRTSGRTSTLVALAILALITVAVALMAWAWGRVAIALAQAWGLGWVAYGRLSGEPESLAVGAAAAIAALVALVVVALRRRSLDRMEAAA